MTPTTDCTRRTRAAMAAYGWTFIGSYFLQLCGSQHLTRLHTFRKDRRCLAFSPSDLSAALKELPRFADQPAVADALLTTYSIPNF